MAYVVFGELSPLEYSQQQASLFSFSEQPQSLALPSYSHSLYLALSKPLRACGLHLRLNLTDLTFPNTVTTRILTSHQLKHLNWGSLQPKRFFIPSNQFKP